MERKELEKLLDTYVECMADKDVDFRMMNDSNKLMKKLHKLISKFLVDQDETIDKTNFAELLEEMISKLEEVDTNVTTSK